MRNLKINYHKFIYPIIIFTVVILADQFTKALATYLNNHLVTKHHIIGKFITFNYVTNTGAAFSSGQGHQMIFNIIAILMVIFALWVSTYLVTSLFSIGILLMGAGALSNCIERLATNKVTDFIQVSFGHWTFPGIFNVADSCVCVGAAILIIAMLLFTSEEKIFDNHDDFIFHERAELKTLNKIDKIVHKDASKAVAAVNKVIHKAESRLHKKDHKKTPEEDNNGQLVR